MNKKEICHQCFGQGVSINGGNKSVCSNCKGHGIIGKKRRKGMSEDPFKIYDDMQKKNDVH